MSSAVDTPGSDVPEGSPWVRLALTAIVVAALLFGAFYLYAAGQALFGAILLAVATGVAVIYGANRFYGARFIFPGIAAVLVFIAFPVIYTVYLGFTNYSSAHLLTFERATEVILSRATVNPETETGFAVAPDGDGYRLWLPDEGLISEPLALDGSAEEVALSPGAEPAELLSTRDAVQLRSGLQAISLTAPDGTILRNSGLRSFAEVTPDYVRESPGVLRNLETLEPLTANHETGFYETLDGETVTPGWRVNVGLENFREIFTNEGIFAPMLRIFVWTVAFAALTVVFTFALGVTLAVILQWEHLAFKPLYRLLLILPYAVPAFISILVFRGLFNQNFGEINLILTQLFGIAPDWFTNGTLARAMTLIVNTWLGYPYIMLLAMGFLQSVPQDHKKAAALEGASSVRVFFTITLPQILPPFVPLLIASFAFNFNNIVLILLLTRGLPDIPGTLIPAGQTDILASFTYRLAFNDSAQQFGLAGAITLLIFLVVAAMSYVNLVAMRRAQQKKAGQ